MTDEELKGLILELICEIAPEADPDAAGDEDDLREIFDLDSMDFANFIASIHRRAGIAVPEADYNRMHTLKSAVAYLSDKAREPSL
jgi:acyl carrier protein